jgi:uncharacterized caspase-like protein
MAKVALLVGVSEYEHGLSPLPCVVRDIEAMRRILQHSEMGDFQEVNILLNRDPLAIQEAIQNLFADRVKEDLALLFFSGHGLRDDSSRFYFATRITRKNAKGELIKATVVPAGFVQEIMSNSRCKRQVVILDCCFSGAFADGMTAKSDNAVDIQRQLGGKGRAVLTSSTSTQYSFEQQGADLSVYTRYIVEGIETGAADSDNDGLVSIEELHEYARRKVQEAAPAMEPKIYAVEEGFKIYIAKAATNDPKLRYRREVERFASRGEIPFLGRGTLDEMRESLKLSPEATATIESEVLQPYQEYQKKLQRYEQTLSKALQHQNSLSTEDQKDLRRYQEILGLRNEDVAPVEERVVSTVSKIHHEFKRQKVFLIGLAGICILGSTGIVAYITNQQSQKLEEATIERIKTQLMDKEYEGCIKESKAISPNSNIYEAAQNLLEECSESVLQEAQRVYQEEGRLNYATALIRIIPETNYTKLKVREIVEKWQKEWRENERKFMIIKDLFDGKNWEELLREFNRNSVTTEYWKNKVEPFVQKAKEEHISPSINSSKPPPLDFRLSQ